MTTTGRAANPPASATQSSDATGLRLYRTLAAQLADGTRDPSTALLETSVAAEFGVSRTPVKEAFIRLEQDGYLERADRGYRLRSVDQQEILDLYEARTVLESGAAAAAASRATDLDLARLEHLVVLHGQTNDPVEAGRLRLLFHESIRDAAHNATLGILLASVITRIRLFDATSTRPQLDVAESLDEHRQVFESIRERDSARARELMLGHLDETRRRRLLALAAAEHR